MRLLRFLIKSGLGLWAAMTALRLMERHEQKNVIEGKYRDITQEQDP